MRAQSKKDKLKRRHRRVRAKVKGTAERPRLCVFLSNKYIYTQLIDDVASKTIASASSLEGNTDGGKSPSPNTSCAERIGALIAERAKEKGVEKVVFDRAGYLYHGKVKSIAESARKTGLVF